VDVGADACRFSSQLWVGGEAGVAVAVGAVADSAAVVAAVVSVGLVAAEVLAAAAPADLGDEWRE
jgi:hypothetical protein